MASESFPSLNHYPRPEVESLKNAFIGKPISEIDPPAHILDVGVVRKNCDLMLDATRQLGVGFRAHIKTHKTIELTKLMVGGDEAMTPVRLIASTIAEIENVAGWLMECVAKGREVNVLYGLPIRPSVIPRLGAVSIMLGKGTVSVFVDHPDHISILNEVDDAVWPGNIPAFVNIDVGDHREGVAPHSKQLHDVAEALQTSEKVNLAGLYGYAGHSYACSSPDEALGYMSDELQGLAAGVLSFVAEARPGSLPKQEHGKSNIIFSIGTTPIATAAQTLLDDNPAAVRYRNLLDQLGQSFTVEFHAGNYTVLDMQQLATRARPKRLESNPHTTLLTSEDIAVRTLVEVAGVYPDRGDKPQALIAAGSLVLGREPCKSYPGWGIVSPWPDQSSNSFYDFEGSKTGWILSSISQEHGVLSWEGKMDGMRRLKIGDKLMVWPNHACIAGAHFGWYLVVDSSSEDPQIIRDVWLRWRGW